MSSRSLQGEAPLVAVAGQILDPHTIITPLQIRVGRADPNQQPEANTASFNLLGEIPPVVILGADVQVTIEGGEGGLWGGYEDPIEPSPGGDVWTDLWSPLDPMTLGLLPPLPPDGLALWEKVSGGTNCTLDVADGQYRVQWGTAHDGQTIFAPNWTWETPIDQDRYLTLTFRFSLASPAPVSVVLGFWSGTTTPLGPGSAIAGESSPIAIPVGSVETWVQYQVTIPATSLYARPYIKFTPPAGAASVRFGPYTATEQAEGEELEKITRFTGRITDLTPQHEDGLLQTQVVATGRKADLGRIVVGSQDWAAETENERLVRMSGEAAAKGVDLIGAGYTWYHAKRWAKRISLLEPLHEMAVSGGLVWETPEGSIIFEAWDYRAAAEVSVSLSAGVIRDQISWNQQIGHFVKRVSIQYASVPSGGTGGTQAEVDVGTSGILQPEITITTTLRDLADAQNFGALVLTRWSDETQWEAPVISVPLHVADSETWDAVMGLAVSQVVETEGLTGSPTPLPYGSNRWFVEGWQETFDRVDEGPILHDLDLAVSDFERFRPDLGAYTVVTDLKVNPVSAKYGTSRTVTGKVKYRDTSAPVPLGDVDIRLSKGQRILGTVTVNSSGAFTYTIDGADVNPDDELVLNADYLGVWGQYKPSTASTQFSVTQPDTAPGEVKAMISLGLSPANTVKSGSTVTLTANAQLTNGNKTPSGDFTFQVSRGGGWNTIDTKHVVDGEAVVKWEATRPDDPAKFRAIFNADLAGVANVTSNEKSINVLGKKSKTKTYSSDWSATYKANGDKRSGVPEMYQGYIDGTNGDQRSLAGFNIPAGDWNGYTITKVEVFLRYNMWWGSSGTALIGSHQHGSEPGNNPNVNARRSKIKGWKEGTGKWVNITGWGKGLANGNLKGICLGPAASQGHDFYGSAVGTGENRPKIRISGYTWS